MRSTIVLKHNIEVAHRLLNLPGKCQQIHGHSMMVSLTFYGDLNDNGLFEGMDFANVKEHFRKHLNEEYDHQLLLNENDPWAQPLINEGTIHEEYHPNDDAQVIEGFATLPGLRTCPGDPTTENIAKWICNWAHDYFKISCEVLIDETGSNSASYARMQ